MRRLALVVALLVTAVSGAPDDSDDVEIKMAKKKPYTLFDTAIATAAPPSELFQSTADMQSWLPPRFLAPGLVGSQPIPTNAWWGNTIASTDDPVVQPMWTNPYALRPLVSSGPFGMAVCYSFPKRVYGDVTGNGVGTNRYYYHTFEIDVVISATEFTAAPTFQVVSWDDLSVALRFSAGPKELDMTLVPGMALVTATYDGLTPRFVFGKPLAAISGSKATANLKVSGKSFVITFTNGQRWVLYTRSNIKLTLSRDLMTLDAREVYTGYVRVGVVTSDAVLAALDQSSKCLLEGSNVEAKDDSSYMFHLKTSGSCKSGLFHYLHVHHIDSLDRTSASIVAGATANSATRGVMTGVVTLSNPPVIRLVENQDVVVDFIPSTRPSAADVSQQRLKETLIGDLNAPWSIPVDGSYYFNGKAISKYANLCLVANDTAVTGSDRDALLRTCLDKLETVLAPFTTNSWNFPLQYDSIYRGIVSNIGLVLRNVNADFGNSIYNDHHYHYGYWLHAAAIVNALDSTWSGLANLNRVATALARDVANPSNNDIFFPRFRNFDWFRGHSFSHGITPFNDGKDQESSSEDINFHYALALFGKATNNANLATIGKLMLKLNTHAVQNYFLMESGNRVHPPTIIPNKVTGIFFDNKIDYTTWFSADKVAIHGIQMIPITPVTEFVRTKKFVQEEWDGILSQVPDVVSQNEWNPWLSLLYTSYATVDKAAAMQKLQNLRYEAMDGGLSRTWALYICATRPQIATT